MQNYPAFGSRWKTLWHLSNDSGFSQLDIEIENAVSACDSTSLPPFATSKSICRDFRKKSNGKSVPNTPKENAGPLSTDAMWKLVSEAAKNICKIKGTVDRNTPFGTQPLEEKKLLSALELSFKAMLSGKDKAGFKDLGQVSDYFYQAQFAPTFYTVELFRGQQAKFLTNRADVDSNADGLGKIGSIKVPQGFQVILYSKKNFKGKKLEINATEGALEIPDLNAITPEKGKIKNDGKKVNWAVNTKSIKIILPKAPSK